MSQTSTLRYRQRSWGRLPAIRVSIPVSPPALYADKMAQVLDENLTRYAAGEITSSEAEENIIKETVYPGVIIYVDSAANYNTVRTFIINNGGEVDSLDAESTLFKFRAYVPIPAFDGLYRLPQVTGITFDTPPVPGLPPQGGSLRPDLHHRKQGAQAHGALDWQAAPHNINGNGVKVGVIDLGFVGFNALIGNQLPSNANIHYSCRLGSIGPPVTGTGVLPAQCHADSNHGTIVSEALYDAAPSGDGGPYRIRNADNAIVTPLEYRNNSDIISPGNLLPLPAPGD